MTKKQEWQRTIPDDDLNDWLVSLFMFAVAEQRLPLESRLSLLALIEANERGKLTGVELVAWSLDHIESRSWKVLKTRVAAKMRARRLKKEKEKE